MHMAIYVFGIIRISLQQEKCYTDLQVRPYRGVPVQHA